MSYAVGFDIGGTKLAVSLSWIQDGTVQIMQKVKCPTPHGDGYLPALEQLENMFFEVIRKEHVSVSDVSGVGISCGGPLDSRSGMILSPPNLPGWDQVPVTEFFRERLGVPVYLQNDADACALAEWKFGAGRDTQNMIFLTFGTGFGAGLILNGRLYSGSCNMAGEIGHIRAPRIDASFYGPVGYGKAGSFEGFCSGNGIVGLGRAVVQERLQRGETVSFCPTFADMDSMDAKSIGDAAEAGDPLALEIYRCSGRYLGEALALLVDLLNPERILIGSIYARSTELLRQSAFEVLERESLAINRRACQVLPAALGESLGDMAAAAIVLNAQEFG